MDFYNFLKQQYENYKIDLDRIFTISCDGCPCRTLRDKLINSCDQASCTSDIIYLANKYKIHCHITACNDLRDVSLIIAKKMSERNNRI